MRSAGQILGSRFPNELVYAAEPVGYAADELRRENGIPECCEIGCDRIASKGARCKPCYMKDYRRRKQERTSQ